MLCTGVIMFGCMLFLLFSLYQVLDMNFIEANKELTAIAPLVPEKFKALGASRMDCNAHHRFSTMVFAGNFSHFRSRNRLSCTAAVSGSFYDRGE